MTRNDFFDKLEELNGGKSPPDDKQQIDVDKIVDTISLRLENKLNTELEKIYKKNNERNEVKDHDRDSTEVKGIDEARGIQGNEDTESNSN